MPIGGGILPASGSTQYTELTYVTRRAFIPKLVVQLPLEAARHIFGYGDDNKEPYLASLGLCLTANEIPDGLKRLANFVITEDAPQKNHSLSPVVEQVPLPPAKRGGGKVLAMTA